MFSRSGAGVSVVPLGTAHLDIVSSTQIQLGVGVIPLKVGGSWVMRPITAAITLGTGGLAASTLYYIYAQDSAGSTVLAASVTGHVTDAALGVEVKSGDATQSLVGMVRTNASTQFVDSGASRLVVSWYNRRRKNGSARFSTTRTTTSTTFVEINTEIRVEILVWADEDVLAAYVGSSAASANACVTSLGIDGTSPEDTFAYNSSTANLPTTVVLAKTGLAEGYHYITVLGHIVTSGTLTYTVLADSAGNRPTLQVSVHG